EKAVGLDIDLTEPAITKVLKTYYELDEHQKLASREREHT
ncbi:14207_t:CDS:2, partial [Gigaspora margarita]